MQDMLANGLSGVAFVGGDICGFQQYATPELCARWAAAGAWQPFARNHHADGFQEFYQCALNAPKMAFLRSLVARPTIASCGVEMTDVRLMSALSIPSVCFCSRAGKRQLQLRWLPRSSPAASSCNQGMP